MTQVNIPFKYEANRTLNTAYLKSVINSTAHVVQIGLHAHLQKRFAHLRSKFTRQLQQGNAGTGTQNLNLQVRQMKKIRMETRKGITIKLDF